MGRPGLSVEIDQDRVGLGEEVRGRVLVESPKKAKCDDLRVRLVMRVHGRGNEYEEVLMQDSIFQGEWRAGESEAYPFSFFLPEHAPYSYEGELIHLDWYITARADVPWAIDPKAEADFQLAPPTDAPLAVPATSAGSAPRGQRAVVSFVLFSLVMLPFWFFVIDAAWESTDRIGAAAFMTILALFTVLPGRTLVRNIREAKKLNGLVSVAQADHADERGTPLQLRVHSDQGALPPVSLLRKVRARLVSAETAVSGSGTSRSTHTARVERSDLVELERRGDAYEGRIVVPHALPPPLDFGDNKVVCAIEFSFYFGRGKPLSFLHTLAVHR